MRERRRRGTSGRREGGLGRARARDGRRVPLGGEERRARGGGEEGEEDGKGECGKTCSLSLHPFPPTDHPAAAAARSKRGEEQEEDRGWKGGGEQEEKGNWGTAEGGTAKGEGLSHAYPLDSSLQSVHVHYLPRISWPVSLSLGPSLSFSLSVFLSLSLSRSLALFPRNSAPKKARSRRPRTNIHSTPRFARPVAARTLFRDLRTLAARDRG